MHERRRCQRIASTRHLDASVRSGEPARVLDLSPHGVHLETEAGLSPGSEHNLALRLGRTAVRLRATIRRCRATDLSCEGAVLFRSGLEFVDMNERQRDLVEDIVAKLCLLSGEAERVA